MTTPSSQPLLDKAMELHRAGRLGEAEEIYRQILAIEPRNWDALHLLGLVAYSVEKYGLAIELMEHALAIEPRAAEAWANLSSVYASADRLKEAVEAGRYAMELSPELELAQLNYATALARQGKLYAAVEIFEKLARTQGDAKTIHNLILAHHGLSNAEQALFWARHQMRQWPEDQNSYLDLSTALQDVASEESFLESIEVLQAALRRWPEINSPHAGLSAAYFALGRFEESRREADISLRLEPDSAVVRFNHAIQLLWAGDYEQGWREYEWRMRRKDVAFPWRKFSQPKWEGQELEGRTLLICAEQGFGDSMQYSRFVPRLTGRGGRIYIACEAELVDLMRSVKGVEDVVDQEGLLPAFDYFLPLPSLPNAVGLTLDTVPAGPGLSAPSELIEAWRDRLEGRTNLVDARRPLRVGLCWAGSPRPFRARSMMFMQLRPLGDIPGIEFHSLQLGAAGEAIAQPSPAVSVVDHRPELTSFAQTAALAANLDLIITIDSAVAHLAASVGKPTWVMLPLAGDWRWRMHEGRCPWYPGVRVFQQTRYGDWGTVVGEVAEALREYAAGEGRRDVKR